MTMLVPVAVTFSVTFDDGTSIVYDLHHLTQFSADVSRELLDADSGLLSSTSKGVIHIEGEVEATVRHGAAVLLTSPALSIERAAQLIGDGRDRS